MQLIDGRRIASNIINQLKTEISVLPFIPVFCDILVGNNPISAQYVDLKAKKARETGIRFFRADFQGDIAAEKLVREIKKLNKLENICGLIVQLPLPVSVDRRAVLDAIDPGIDVDCIGEKRNAEFYEGDLEMIPPTAAAIMFILDALGLDLKSKNILVLGQGELVGRPVAHLLRLRDLSIHTADITTSNTDELIRWADVIVSGTGQPKLIKGDKIKKNCVVIDAGTAEDGGEIVGDVDFDSVKDVAQALSPVPGGVGPVTVAMLLKNVVKAAKLKLENRAES